MFFVLSLLSVFDVIDKYIILAAVAVGMLFIDRKAFIGADYGLLLTFVAFFILRTIWPGFPRFTVSFPR